MTDETKRMADAAEMLWVVLANVSGSDWSGQTQEWQDAAARWRDNYFTLLFEFGVLPPVEPDINGPGDPISRSVNQ